MEVKMTIPQAHFSNLEVSDEQLMIGSRLVRRKDWMHGDIVHCYQISLSLLKPLLDTGRFVVRS
ncbi:unnamed protein product [Soboliphyme baturini]|uniref:DUF3553 domain-containing protein n=1 Tax=Soboliphyme baturini TaxID=241478 RepID=A0A183IA94_9BILA|nr:unnamed protein product [Soboliphyme baturini]